MRTLFYYLSAFKTTGGIEKFNRSFIKALGELDDKAECTTVGVYDEQINDKYAAGTAFRGFAGKKRASLFYIIGKARETDILILGHINLCIAGLLVKLLNPRCKLVIVAHGIEVWKKFGFISKKAFNKADTVLAVSNYTKNQLVLRNRIDPAKIKLFPNTIDPYFLIPESFQKPGYLLDRYGIKKGQPVILTLSRLAGSERYKGYDNVISAMPQILEKFPDAVYILAGKSDLAERGRVEQLVAQHNLQSNVVFTGFVPDEEVPDHYQLADVFIMPSRKEGFGIVFLEALVCGTAVIGGNQDGTVDALRNGALGTLINPVKVPEIVNSLNNHLSGKRKIERFENQREVLNSFGYPVFKQRLSTILT